VRESRALVNASASAGAAALLSDSAGFVAVAMSDSTFERCDSRWYGGVAERVGRCNLTWAAVNASDCAGQGGAACFVLHAGACRIAYADWARCRGGYFNSGIALISCESFCVEHCRFRGLARELSAQYGAVAVHVNTCQNK
jgi:hypothetical protein